MDQHAQALEAPLKMRMALGYLPALPEDTTEAFEAWLAAAAAAGSEPRARPRYGVATDARFQAVAWRASYDAAGLARGLAALVEDVASDEELARLDVALEAAAPARVAHWIEARTGALERGWRVLGEQPLARALALADPNPKVVALAELGEAHGFGPVQRLGRSVGLGGNRFTEVLVRLPGAGEEALDLGLEAYRALKAPRLPGLLVEAMRMALRGPLSLSVWLTEHALSHVGLVLAHPTTVEVLRLGHAIGAEQMQPLAAIEGALGVEGPFEVECAVGAGGPTVQMEYEL